MIFDSKMENDIRAGAALLKAGETVAFPTETVYGLGADASNPLAIQKVFTIKGRPSDHPLIVHIADVTQLDLWAENIPRVVWRLSARFWPGPLTLILPRRREVPKEVTGGQDTVAVRIPDHPVATALLQAFGGGIVGPSANMFGRVSPTTAQHVREGLGSKVGMVLDGGPCRVGVESTILSFLDGQAVLLRPGGLSIPELEDTLGQPILVNSGEHKVRAPGMLASHYSPVTSLEVLHQDALSRRVLEMVSQGRKVAVLKLGDDGKDFEIHKTTTIFMPSSPVEYGRELYSTLHRLDRGAFDCILIESLPDEAEWMAVNDRVLRAAHVFPMVLE
ncbi:L-threonylcarbamoyladenylate synthase [Leptospirillum ferrooxidans]|uniref:Threonylcarbamoyl-AMP synthase n=1 Tax=Leptospirillum ferrooxidans (strain C2-3) TaxID=1162668 RepID=I0IQF7_LEPFC|nr:L-threonylcarbamoyladenylate synthase [Leptospirillum ferrooxidans]BAM07506.1 putative Sua5/YciO/YrdC/YwlC family protein [Leptospirillum ferrooxidans C2-3]